MKKNYLKIISSIEKVRRKNNKNWMDILRLAFAAEPKKTANRDAGLAPLPRGIRE